MEIRKVGIVGLGSIGSIYAYLFTESFGRENVFIIADDDRITKYRKDGLYVNGELMPFNYVYQNELLHVDLMIFATKFYDLDQAIKLARGATTNKTVIFSFVNGVTSEDIIADKLGSTHVLYSTVQGMNVKKKGNRVEIGDTGFVAFGDKSNTKTEDVKAVEMAFDRACIRYQIPEDIMKQLYSKWMCNVGLNQTCAYFGEGYGAVHPSGPHHETFKRAMEEARKCAVSEGINLTEDEIEKWVRIVGGLDPQGEPSMLQDIKAGHRTEIELFAGTVIRLAKKHGIQVPINEEFFRRLA